MDAYELSIQLYELNKRKNEGAGMPIIFLIIEELRRNDIIEARRIADWNWGVLKEEHDIAEVLTLELFGGKF